MDLYLFVVPAPRRHRRYRSVTIQHCCMFTSSRELLPMPAPVWGDEHRTTVPEISPGPARLGGGSTAITAGDSSPTPLFFAGAPWRGDTTKVFGWVGLPKDIKPGEQCPGMVLLHGGGGTAFDVWVQLWTDRGYAAICFDQCGDLPDGSDAAAQWSGSPGTMVAGYAGDGAAHQRHADGGPPGWDASFGQVEEPLEDQWTYHAVAAALRAHTLLASLPQVDPSRIGLTGICKMTRKPSCAALFCRILAIVQQRIVKLRVFSAWGGYMTCVVAGVDPRYKIAAPVYGCGFIGQNSVWAFPGPASSVVGPIGAAGGRGAIAEWLRLWDPSVFLPSANMPLLVVNGSNDFACEWLSAIQGSVHVSPLNVASTEPFAVQTRWTQCRRAT